ncbi:hypothetical protein MMC27_003219 [Xylographa pallens]|nr:hypothetical protein [Xylographa pallens]
MEASMSQVDAELFHQLDIYLWTSDEEFQSGLRAILGPNPKPEQAEQLTLRARCFYYSRKHNVAIDFYAYREWHAQQGSSTQMKLNNAVTQSTVPREESSEKVENKSAEPPAPYPLSFSHIVDLITSGQPVPGVKEIPNTVLDGQASRTKRPQRRKPWETARSDEAVSQTASTRKSAEGGH